MWTSLCKTHENGVYSKLLEHYTYCVLVCSPPVDYVSYKINQEIEYGMACCTEAF